MSAQPAIMRTKIDANSVRAARPIDDYAVARGRAGASIRAKVEHGDDPALVAKAVVAALRADRPKLRHPVGKGAGTLAALRDLMPAGLFDRGLRKQFGLDAEG